MSRLKPLVITTAPDAATTLVNKVTEAVGTYAGAEHQADDLIRRDCQGLVTRRRMHF